MKFDKLIWKIFKMNMSEFNKAESNIENILIDVYNKGKEAGKKEEQKRLKEVLK